MPRRGSLPVLQRSRGEVLAVGDRQRSAVTTRQLPIGGSNDVDGRTSNQRRDQRDGGDGDPPASEQTCALRHADALDNTRLEADGWLSRRSEHEHVVDDLAEQLELVPAVQTTTEM